MKGFLFALMFALASFLLPSRTASAQAVQNCTNGCYVSTCSGGNCMVWYCNASGCRIVGSYRQQQPQQKVARAPVSPVLRSGGVRAPDAFQLQCDVDSGQVCPVQTCEGSNCTVRVFDGTKFVVLTQTKNVEKMVQDLTR